MKKLFLILILCMGMIACSHSQTEKKTDNLQEKKDMVEVLYFHGAQRCKTCKAIEQNAKKIIESNYADEINIGKLVFKSIDLTQENELAKKYEVTWSSLFVIDYDCNGNENATNLTDFAFATACNAPDKFKSGLSEQLTKMLNN